MSGASRRSVVAAVFLGVVLGVFLALAVLVTAPRLLGWQPVTVVSGSMGPIVRPGDVVLIDPGPRHPVPVGAVITYRQPGTGRTITHRVVSVDRGAHSYRTRGDANPVADSDPIPEEAVLGRVRLLVPFAGLPMLLPGARTVLPVLLAGAGAGAGLLVRRQLSRPDRPTRRSASSMLLFPPVLMAGVGLLAAGPILSGAAFASTTSAPFTLATGGWSVFTRTALAMGPVSYWPLDETSGSAVADVAGTSPMLYASGPTLGLPGAVTGTGKRSMGIVGTAQGAATSGTPPASLDLRGPMSVMVWAKLPTGSNTTNGRVVAKFAYTNPGGVSYLMALDSSATSMRFLLDLTAGTPSRPTASTPALLDNAWHFFVGTWDGSSVRIYRDGVLRATTPVTGAGQIVSTNTKVTVGAPASNDSALGQMDEVAIWNRALSDSEISTLYATASS